MWEDSEAHHDLVVMAFARLAKVAQQFGPLCSLALPVIRIVARIESPSTRAAITRTRSCLVSLFLLTILLERSRIVKQKSYFSSEFFSSDKCSLQEVSYSDDSMEIFAANASHVDFLSRLVAFIACSTGGTLGFRFIGLFMFISPSMAQEWCFRTP